MGFKTKNDNKKDGRKQKGQKKAEQQQRIQRSNAGNPRSGQTSKP